MTGSQMETGTNNPEMSNLQAVLYAAGEPKKLRPLTEKKPSPMIRVVNRPVMEIAIEQLARQGVKQIFVCLYHFPGSIEAYFGDGRRWGVRLEYVLMQDNWGTAGVLRWFVSSITEKIIYLHADRIIDIDIDAAVNQHKTNQNLITVVVTEKSILERDVNNTTVNASGVYIIEPEVLDWIPLRRKWDIHNDLIPKISSAGLNVGSYVLDGYWNPLETIRDVQDAQIKFLYSAWGDETSLEGQSKLRYPFVPGFMSSPGVWIGRNSSVHKGAQLIPPVLIGDHSWIGHKVELGPDVIIGNNVIVADEATIRSSTIFDQTYAGRLVRIENRMIDTNLVVDIESEEHVYISDHFLFTETPSSIELVALERGLEFIFASLILIFSIPLMITIAILLFALEGKVFQSVPSVRSRREFKLLHFRTKSDDGGHTSVGKWLEKVEFHRLPELWNVLKGDMHLVGVKPLEVETAKQLTEEWQQAHHDYPPGMTGLWYLQSDSNSDLDEILVADIFYLTTRNIQEDLRIVLRTPAAWFRRLKSLAAPELEWQH